MCIHVPSASACRCMMVYWKKKHLNCTPSGHGPCAETAWCLREAPVRDTLPCTGW